MNLGGICAGHWLGMDTHDCPSQSQDQMLQPGVVMTLEPGLYIPNLERCAKVTSAAVTPCEEGKHKHWMVWMGQGQ